MYRRVHNKHSKLACFLGVELTVGVATLAF